MSRIATNQVVVILTTWGSPPPSSRIAEEFPARKYITKLEERAHKLGVRAIVLVLRDKPWRRVASPAGRVLTNPINRPLLAAPLLAGPRAIL
jgi:hypothetical protein